MSEDFIIAIGELYKLVLSIALLLGIILFRRQIGGFIDRLRTIKLGNKELQTDKEIVDDNNDKESQQLQEESVIDADEGVEETSKPDDGFRSMVKAFEDSDYEMAERAYGMEKETAKTEDDKRILQAWYLHYRYTKASDPQAIAELRNLSSHQSTRANVLSLLALCFWETKDYATAREVYVQARDWASEEHAARITASIADCWHKEGDPNSGLAEVVSRLQEAQDTDAKVHLYKSLASMFEANGAERMRAIALEKAIEFVPHDTELRFSAAYAQGQAKLSAVSIANYDTLLNFKPKEGNPLNNLGVECRNVNLNQKSVDFYLQAAEEGNTLAMANLAYLFMETGFHDKAAEVLERASQLPNAHENVASAKVQLEKQRSVEDDKWDNLVDVGAKQQQFLRDFAQAWIDTTNRDLFSGTWKSPNGEVCTLKGDVKEIRLEVTHYNARRKLEATTYNRTAEGRLLHWKRELLEAEGSFRDGVDALAVVSPDGATLSILELGEPSDVLRMQRVSDPA